MIRKQICALSLLAVPGTVFAAAAPTMPLDFAVRPPASAPMATGTLVPISLTSVPLAPALASPSLLPAASAVLPPAALAAAPAAASAPEPAATPASAATPAASPAAAPAAAPASDRPANAVASLSALAAQADAGGVQFDGAVPTAETLFLKGKFGVKRPWWKFWDESHGGEELDLSVRRPVVNLAGTVFEAKYGRPGTSLFANFYHAGKFYIARVPKQAVEDVDFHIAYFPPIVAGQYIAAHSLLRFRLGADTPIELVAEMPDEAALQALAALPPAQRVQALPPALDGDYFKIRNAAISGEAQWTKNDKTKSYDLMRGKRGAYMQIDRFVSMVDRFKDFYLTGNPTAQVDLPSYGNYDGILAEGLRTSAAEGISKIYDTLWHNCTTVAFDILNRALGNRDQRLDHILAFMEKRIPTIAEDKLKQYGGIAVKPIWEDPTLLQESLAAYLAVHKNGDEPLCAPGMAPENCAHIKAAVQTLRDQGLLPPGR